MFLLIRLGVDICTVTGCTFTFQYVSINTARSGSRYIELLRFTFQYVSINTVADKITAIQEEPLHSNMFLLIHIYLKNSYIHSLFTFQYVSINTWQHPSRASRRKFTFQYVSINTTVKQAGTLDTSLFTFQYVSINTKASSLNMRGMTEFTFQYVSINTGSRYIELLRGHLFTFQYVSINTRQTQCVRDMCFHLHSNMFLLIPERRGCYNFLTLIYIPICFY